MPTVADTGLGAAAAADADGADPATKRGFVALARRVVLAEHAAELQSLACASARPAALARLRVADTSGAAGGRTLLALAPLSGGAVSLGARELSAGDPVELRPAGARGVVWRITGERVVVSIDADDAGGDALAGRVELVRLASDVTFQRQIRALDRLEASFRHPVADVFFGVTAPSFDDGLRASAREHVAKRGAGQGGAGEALNAEQTRAVCDAVAASQLALVHGPPGTGKTGTLAAAIEACVRVRGERVLAVAPSNVAADNLLERVVEAGPALRVVRVGNPARLSDRVLERSLDELVADEYGGVGRQIQRDVSVVQRVLWGRSTREEKDNARATLRELRKEQRRREKDAILFILERADVVVTTCAGAFASNLQAMRGAGVEETMPDNRYPFDAVFVDEAANALEPVAWCALLLGRRCVLAGDDQQLPPTVVSDDAEVRRVTADLTAFARAKRVLGTNLVLLRRQYRMHAVIGQFSSESFYDRMLLHDESCCERNVAGLVKGRLSRTGSSAADADFPNDLTHGLIFIDTAGCDFYEAMESGLVDEDVFKSGRKTVAKKTKKSKQVTEALEEGENESEDDVVLDAALPPKRKSNVGSRLNEGEAGVVVAHCLNLVNKCGIACEEIACIAPYSAQCRRLRALLDDAGLRDIEVGTVDGLQGREKDVVVFSATRSSELGGKQGIGFLGETRRFNVAVSSVHSRS